MAVPQLPVEIYIEILTSLPSSADEPSERTLVNCLLACSLLRSAALAPAVWKGLYRARYTHSVPEREKQRRDEAGNDWRVLYAQRRRMDREALSLLDSIRKERVGRHQHARTLVREYSFDVWDALRQESLLPTPNWYQGTGASEDTDVRVAVLDYALPRRYWARTVLGVIARHYVLGEWAKLVTPRRDEVDFIQAMSGLSAFFEVSPTEVAMLLDDVCTVCIQKVKARGIQLNPQEPDYNIWALCDAIRAAIHEQGFRLAPGNEFYNTMSQFPHHFLQPAHRATIPISLVYIFVAVARRLGINASPANYPGVVKAHIQPSDQEPPKLLDMCGTEPPITMPYQQYTPLAQDFDDYTRPASVSAMLSRACNNIMHFIREERNPPGSHQFSHETHEIGYYVATCWLQLDDPIGEDGFVPPSNKPLDILAVIVDGLSTALPPEIRTGIVDHCEAHVEMEDNDIVRYRASNPTVKYFVGLVFKHKHYHYIGCIYGWDVRCQQSQFWMEEMGVDILPHGRDQPFYHVLPTDGRPRYVGQDNIEPIAPHRVINIARGRSTFDCYFTDVGWDETGARGRLLLSEELQDAYPDDDAYGATWVKSATLGGRLL